MIPYDDDHHHHPILPLQYSTYTGVCVYTRTTDCSGAIYSYSSSDYSGPPPLTTVDLAATIPLPTDLLRFPPWALGVHTCRAVARTDSILDSFSLSSYLPLPLTPPPCLLSCDPAFFLTLLKSRMRGKGPHMFRAVAG